jgi:hypothetical protein
LVRILSPVTSRSNWAKESKTLKVSRPMETGGVELLGDGNEGDAAGIESLNDLGEIGQTASQPVYSIYNDGVDLVGFDVSEQLLEGRALEIPT